MSSLSAVAVSGIVAAIVCNAVIRYDTWSLEVKLGLHSQGKCYEVNLRRMSTKNSLKNVPPVSRNATDLQWVEVNRVFVSAKNHARIVRRRRLASISFSVDARSNRMPSSNSGANAGEILGLYVAQQLAPFMKGIGEVLAHMTHR